MCCNLQAGAVTHFVGKWHAGFTTPEATPTRRGFRSSLGFFGKAHDHMSHCSIGRFGTTNALATKGASLAHCRTAPGNVSVPLYDLFERADTPGPAHAAARQHTYSTTLYRNEATT